VDARLIASPAEFGTFLRAQLAMVVKESGIKVQE
jgi:hypothetical protein